MNHLAVIPLADNVLSNSYLKYFCTVRERSLIESQFDNFFSQKKIKYHLIMLKRFSNFIISGFEEGFFRYQCQ